MPPLFERGLAICFKPFGSGKSGDNLGWLQGGDERPCDSLIDLDAADIEAIHAAALDKNSARAMITWRRVAAAIMGVQATTAVAACGEPLQQGTAFSHGATRLGRSGSRVLGDAHLISLVGLPVEEAQMGVRDET